MWLPSLLRVVGDGPALSYVEEEVRPSRHLEVSRAVWSASRRVFPNAAELAGTFGPVSPLCVHRCLVLAQNSRAFCVSGVRNHLDQKVSVLCIQGLALIVQ